MKKWVLLLPFILLTACTDHSKPNVELIQDMMETPAIKAQEYDESSPNHSGMRLPPENTVPQGFKPYAYAKDFEGALKQKNPLEGNMSEDVLATGLKYFNTNCQICHGARGEGGVAAKSTVSEFMNLKPPALTSAKIKGWTDGNIYHVITMGQGVMGPYASHIPEQYRWQVVNYIRHLQKNSGSN
jgi:mono/diheme cytochrome c family protein